MSKLEVAKERYAALEQLIPLYEQKEKIDARVEALEQRAGMSNTLNSPKWLEQIALAIPPDKCIPLLKYLLDRVEMRQKIASELLQQQTEN